MDVWEVVQKRRSIRCFTQNPIDRKILTRMVDAARLAPSESNTQPLKWLVVDREDLLPRVFEHVKWAGYIAPRGNPPEGKRPTAYVLVLVDTRIKDSGYQRGLGAAVENLLLTGEGEGVAGCWIATVNVKALSGLFNLPDHFVIDSVVALGYPDQTSLVEPLQESVKYWLDEDRVLHVPKRVLADVLFFDEVKS